MNTAQLKNDLSVEELESRDEMKAWIRIRVCTNSRSTEIEAE